MHVLLTAAWLPASVRQAHWILPGESVGAFDSLSPPAKSIKWQMAIESHQAFKSGWPVLVLLSDSDPYLWNCGPT